METMTERRGKISVIVAIVATWALAYLFLSY
jgi:hypothetical protein